MNKAAFALAAVALSLTLTACSENPNNISEEADSQLKADANLPEGILNKQALIRYSMAVSEYQPKDEFSPKDFDDSKLVGRHIVVEQRYYAWIDDMLPSIYTYDVDTQKLTFSISPPVGLAYIQTDLGSQKKSNAFGTTVDVKMSSTEVFFLGYLPPSLDALEQTKPLPEIGVFKIKKHSAYGPGAITYTYEPITKTLEIRPDDARKLTDGLRLLIDATAIHGPSGRTVECETDYKTAKIDSPTEGLTTRCAVAVKFNKLAIYASHGKMLAEWK